mmetsp:Transcript_21134/g.73006  ORF Transcript_21134/g.73006 Transcript_21134/m.73006 type:complete len:1779 (-) Transcript_21134:904-6240(-)
MSMGRYARKPATDAHFNGATWVFSLLNGLGQHAPLESDDPCRLTPFPNPGDAKRSFKELTPNSERRERREAIPGECNDWSQSLGNVADHRHSRDYWMPDRLCKTCYECELQFNMFRRRHHCRFCGQVFCHSCASYFVDGKSVFLTGMVRACKLCHDQVTSVPAAIARTPQTVSISNDSFVLTGVSDKRPGLKQTALVNSRSIGSRFEEPGNRAAYDVRSLTTLHDMDLQQEFEEESSMPFVDATSSASDMIGLDNALGTSTSKVNLVKQDSVDHTIEVRKESARSNLIPVVLDNSLRMHSVPSKDALGDGWLKTTFSESVEANLRRRLLGSTSAAAPMSVMSATSMNIESTTDLVRTRCHLSSSAAQHLGLIVKSLVLADVCPASECSSDTKLADLWSVIILKLVDQVCTTVNPNIRAGDHMDIRPYVKLKTIPGGSVNQCCYIDGVVFRKHVVHKRMARTCRNPRILLLSGGIEFQRTCSRLASFGTLMEQEQRYTQIMIDKIVRLRPDLLLVGQSVSRQAQEYLHQHEVIVIQNVKPNLMNRIARMTGAAVLSSTDHVNNMGKLGCASIGHCQRFQMVAYRNLHHHSDATPGNACSQASNSLAFSRHHCKRVRGHGFINYVYLAGCPKGLGCSILLRGEHKTVLKQIKRIVRFAIYVAYHLRLETSYLLDCGASLSTSNQQDFPECSNSDLLSTSLAVRFDNTIQHSRKDSRLFGGIPLTTAYDHQSLLVTSVWMSQHIQCASAEVKAILFYTPQDVCLGQFLLDSCFNLDLKFPHSERRSVLDITQMFNHNDGRLTVTVIKLDQSLPVEPPARNQDCSNSSFDRSILMWSYCRKCERIVTPLVPMSDDTWKMSFGKYLEVSFYNKSALGRTSGCKHRIQSEHIHFFGCGNLAARIEYDSITLYTIHTRKELPFDHLFHAHNLQEQYHHLRGLNQQLSKEFEEKIRELQTLVDIAIKAEDTAQDDVIFTTPESSSNFCLAVNSETNRILLEIQQHSSKLEKHLAEALLGSGFPLHTQEIVVDVMHFPGQFRRELYIHATNWNAQLSLLGQLVTTVQGTMRTSNTMPSDASTAVARDDLVAAELHRLQQIKQALHKATSRADIRAMTDDDELEEGMADEQYERLPFDEHSDSTNELSTAISKKTPELSASCAQLTPYQTRMVSSVIPPHELEHVADNGSCDQPSLMTNALLDLMPSVPKVPPSQDQATNRNQLGGEFRREKLGPARRTYKLSSAFARFMGKESPEEDPWTINLGELEGGRPCLDMGCRGEVLLVHEGQPTTIIAYSLNTAEYAKALRGYLDSDLFSPPSSFMSTRTPYTSSGTHNATPPICSLPSNVVGAENSGVANASISTATHSNEITDSTYLPWAGGLASLITPNDNPASYHDSALTRSMNLHPVTESSKFIQITTADSHQLRRAVKLTQPASLESCEIHEQKCPQSDIPTGSLERQLLSQQKTHVKHRFADVDRNGNTLCKFVCQAYWATQFAAVRQAYLGLNEDEEIGYLRSLSMARPWNAQGGKSGATFFKTADGRFVVKQITRTELQMFLEYAPAYFEYLSKSFFHKYDTLLVKVLGVYQIGSHNRVNGRRIMEQVVVMENLFHDRIISRAFDLKGSTRSRYARVTGCTDGTASPMQDSNQEQAETLSCKAHPVLLDENFMEFTNGRPLPLRDQAKAYFNSAVLNDTLFLSLINVVDYSILVGMDEENHELVVGIIDYMRQYDIIKKMERMGKSVGMIAGQAEPTVIQPPNYRNRFQAAMERYFMMVPDKWTSFRMQQVG